MFILVKIGCLCCIEESNVIAWYTDGKQAYKDMEYLRFYDRCNSSIEYDVFEIDEHASGQMNEYYKDILAIGKKRYDEHIEKYHMRMAQKQKKEDIRKAYQRASSARDDTIDENYIKMYIPDDILKRMSSELEWTDDDGYVWGLNNVSAKKDENDDIYIVLAVKCDSKKVYHVNTKKISMVVNTI